MNIQEVNIALFHLINNFGKEFPELNPLFIVLAEYTVFVLALAVICFWIFNKKENRIMVISGGTAFVLAEILGRTAGLLFSNQQPFAALSDVNQLIDYLTASGYLLPSEGQYPLLSVTNAGIDVLLGKAQVFRKQTKVKQLVVDDALFDQFRSLRLTLAQEQNLPPYVVLSDQTLRQLAEVQPKSPIEFLQIKGVGQNKLDKYGDAFLALLADYAEQK